MSSAGPATVSVVALPALPCHEKPIASCAAQCYEGTHLSLWVPVGAVAVALLCLAPPIVTFMIMWRIRDSRNTPAVINRFGFLYARYKEDYYYFESILQLQVGCNVSHSELVVQAYVASAQPHLFEVGRNPKEIDMPFLDLGAPSSGAEPGGGGSLWTWHVGYEPGLQR